jgi:urea transport system permease protein
LVNAGKSYFTAALPEYWLFALGALFVIVTLFLPRGIVGLISGPTVRRSKTASAAAESGVAPSTLHKVEPAE